jgi:signal transduction histidine kinase
MLRRLHGMAGWRRLRGWEARSTGLVLLGMALFVAAVYVVVVRVGGALTGSADSSSLALSVVATAIVALGFEPVRRRLRPIAARVVRGERAAPYEVMARFLAEVADGYATEEIPARMARLLAEGTGARYAQVWLHVDGSLTLAATLPPEAATADAGRASPDATDPPTGRRELAVRHAEQELGILVVQERDRQPLTPVEEQLFAGLAAQAGLVLRSVRLRAELALRLTETAHRARELSASRERIIAAQDEERRRLERNIHDGAQQHLVALAVNLRLARALVARSSDRLPAVLTDLTRAAEDTIDTLSDLSRGIYPRALSEQGLAAALEAVAAVGSLRVDLAIDELPRPRPDIEAALYFCCLEALQNAAKHSGANRAVVRLGRRADGLALAVSDDGKGFAPHTVGPGNGLINMRDRAESAGGRLRVDSGPGRGTQIEVQVPWVAADQRGEA